MVHDTSKWPNGCPSQGSSNPEVGLNGSQAGLSSVPVEGDQGDGCVWTAEDIAKWDGPYVYFGQDPWGNEYYFDPDYHVDENRVGEDCDGYSGNLIVRPVVVSFGPNGEGDNVYDCDNIWLNIE